MKLILSLILVFSFTSICFGQQQNVIAKFIITDARANKNDVTPSYTNNGSYFVFYTVPGEKEAYFGSVMPKSNSQSFGRFYDLDMTSTPETTTQYASDTFTFKWSYSNSYNNHQGTASVKLVKITKPAGVAFELTIIPENLDVLEYKGYMEGSLQALR